MTNTTATFQPSAYQQRVLDFVESGKGSTVVIAVAGAGKTKTIELSLPLIPESQYVTILAFNKTIATELNSRLDGLRTKTGRAFRNFRASTFHSLGVGSVARKLNVPMSRMQIDDRKCRKLAEKMLSEVEYSLYGDFIVKLVGFAKGEGVGAIRADVEDAWWDLMRHHDLALESEDAVESDAVAHARALLQASNDAAKGAYIDFDDMLYLPLLWKLRLWQNDWVIVDEAQDTSPVRRALAKLALKPGGRSMWVGDPKQAIYGFTGASAQAIELIKREFNATELPLTVCYRCATDVVAEAKTIVPYIEASDSAPKGKVEWLDMVEALKVLDDHDAILCQNTAPLIQTAYALIAKGRGCVVLGREIGQGLVNLIKRMKAKNIDELEVKLAAYREREVAKFMARGEEQKAERVNDTVDCINVVIGNLDETQRTIVRLVQKIESLFSDTNGVLTLATVHKAKGREWKRVGILRPDLMPSKWARQDWQVEQENNLKYVAITRAMEHLIWIAGEAA